MVDLKKITVRMVEGVPLFMPGFIDDHFPCLPISDFPHFCGAGDGIGERAVPDSILLLYISVACWVHDCMFSLLSPQKDNWYIANGVLLLNIFMLVIVKGSRLLVIPRSMIAVQYFWGVMTGTGWRCFTNRVWVDNYNPYQDDDLKLKFKKVGVFLTPKVM